MIYKPYVHLTLVWINFRRFFITEARLKIMNGLLKSLVFDPVIFVLEKKNQSVLKYHERVFKGFLKIVTKYQIIYDIVQVF